MVERYAHLSDSHRKQAIKKIGQVFSRKEEIKKVDENI